MTVRSSGRRAIIAGAGIGGLTAAIALARAGIDVVVLERVRALSEVGAAIALWPNAVQVLDTLEIGEAVRAAGATIRQAEFRSWRGDVLGRLPFDRLAEQAGAPFIALHRAELQRILAHAVGPRLRLGSTVTGFEQDVAGATVRFGDGDEVRGDLLVGADGLHSAVRAQLLGRQRPRYAGYTAWRGIARIDHPALPPGVTSESAGHGQRFGLVPIGRGRIYWFATANVPEGSEPDGTDRQAELRQRFAGWHRPIEDVIAATDPAAILRNDIYDRPPVSTWGAGRVTLLGDAAHPTTPNVGQGACLAIEDALVLARCLARDLTTEAALRRYEAIRIPRTASIVRLSWRFGQVGQWSNPLAVRLREALFRLTPTSLTTRQLARLLEFETG